MAISDTIKFGVYTLFFSAVFLGARVVLTPETETGYDSSSVYHRESIAFETAEPREWKDRTTVKDQEMTKDDTPKSSVEIHSHEDDETSELPEILSSAARDTMPSDETDASSGAFARKNFTITLRPTDARVARSFQEAIETTLSSRRFSERAKDVMIILDADRDEPRGQATGRTVTLALSMDDIDEFSKVLVHEIGHVVDIRYFTKNVFGFDRSRDFYAISWTDAMVKRSEAELSDFPSGYALSNQYEDFAESFAYYVFHNDEFRARTRDNPAMRRKYEFLSKYVFSDASFQFTSFGVEDASGYFWDTTKLPIDSKKYLFYIRDPI